jgi:nitronate monooxygenase
MAWPDTRLLDLFGIELPIVQAPMANATAVDMAVAVANAGGLGSFPCAVLNADQVRAGMAEIRSRTAKPVNVNFFCHAAPDADTNRDQAWLQRLASYYAELGAEAPAAPLKPGFAPFGDAVCAAVEELRPEAVSFHFGLPEPSLFARVKTAGCKIMASATSVREAKWLAAQGVDAIIAQGAEAGGHRGMFLDTDVATQIGTFGLVPRIVDVVPVPVIAAGGIGDGRGVAAAFALGAAGVQIGTAYLGCPEAKISSLHKAALAEADRDTAITNVFTGRPSRGILNRFLRESGRINKEAPAFPLATPAVSPLRGKAEAEGSGDFSPLWSGQGPGAPRAMGAHELTRTIAAEALARLRSLSTG